jgi:hypothetical protein
MSNFLERLASRAVRPTPNAHPFVESIYPATRRNGAVEPSERYEAFAAPVEQAAGQGFRSEFSMEESRRINQRLTQTEGMRLQQSETAQEREFFQPLLPQPEVGSNVVSKLSRHDGEASGTASFSASPALRQEFASTLEGLEYVPLVADRFARTDLSDLREVHSLPAPGEGEPVSARARQGRQSPQVELARHSLSPQADDIQIHIGRIEVVAVPQAAPRPAAAPTRKGLSLDEYLNRRDGRAG